MTRQDHTFSVKAADKRWLRKVRQYAVPYSANMDPDLKIFDPKIAKARNYVVAPFLGTWNGGDPEVIDVLRKRVEGRLFATNLPGHEERFASAELNPKSIWAVMGPLLRECFFVPRSEIFFVLSLPYDYWLVSGPQWLVEELAGLPLEQTFSEVREELAEGNVFDPSDEFFDLMLSLYEQHNKNVINKR